MPRDGTGNYNQPFPNVAPDTTIESVVYNGFVQDVALDLNAARPIISGGTGAASADDALLNIGGEKASQVVTNYDSHIWQAGSFYSMPGATGGPIDGYIGGICYMTDSDHITLEAKQYVSSTTTPMKYVRQKASGVWGTWLAQDPATGGTVTGDITISKADPSLNLNATTASEPVIRGQRSGVTRWGMSFASLEPEADGNTGSDWYLAAFSDAGSYIHTALYADRATGLVTVNGNPTAALGIATKQMVDLKAPIAGPFFTGDISINGKPFATNTGTYNAIYEPTGANYSILVGPLSEPSNYYRQTNHYFQSVAGGVAYLTLSPTTATFGLNLAAPTPAAVDNSTRVPTTAWVRGYAQPYDAQLFAGIPPIGKASGAGSSLSDGQKMILAVGSFTIDGAVHPVGTCLSFLATGGTLAIGNTETMWYNLGGTVLSGSRSLSNVGVATAVKYASGAWVISGNGLT